MSGRPSIVWTEEMVATLLRLRGSGVPLYECAERIGVSYETVCRKAQAMDIAGRLNRGRTRGVDAA